MPTPSNPEPAALRGLTLDHVAVAVERWSDAWPTFVSRLGGRWKSGGQQPGFAPSQYRFANGARLEVLAPWNWEGSDFLRRFLDHSGPGPHHVTFKVPDIRTALEAVTLAGFSPTSVDLTDPGWMELFLHPKQAMGIVIQLAQAAADWDSPPPPGLPAPADPPAALLRVTHVVADLGVGLGLFRDLLGGTVAASGRSADGTTDLVELSWAGPLCIRLACPEPGTAGAPLREWLGGRPGRTHHLAFEAPAGLEDRGPPSPTAEAGMGLFPGEPSPMAVLEPLQTVGTRIVLLAPSSSL